MTLREQEQAVHDAIDRERERARRPRPCCSPEMCPRCYDEGGHATGVDKRPRTARG